MNQLESLVSSLLALGGRPEGDAAAMLAQGECLRRFADEIDTANGLLQRQSRIPYYEGPQADNYELEIERHVRNYAALARDMHHAADGVIKGAGKLADAQVRWDRQLQKRVSGIPPAIVRQAERVVGLR